MKRLQADLHRLSTQMLLSFVLLGLLTAVAAGLPALWVLRSQLDAQAWARVDQGTQASQALYQDRLQALGSLATLTAERPSLRSLLAGEDLPAMTTYLQSLQEGAGVDLLLICTEDPEPRAQASAGLMPLIDPQDLCGIPPAAGLIAATRPSGVMPQAWMFAARAIGADQDSGEGKVVVGQWLDREFVDEMRAQTGLDHTVAVGGLPLASTLPGDPLQRQPPATAQDGVGPAEFVQGDEPYYARHWPLSMDPGLPGSQADAPVSAEVALAVSGVVATQQRLVRILAASILLAAALGSALAILLTRRIARPLAELAGAAAAMSRDDLSSPMVFEARVREVALVGQALEGARADLQRTLEELRREKAWTDHLLGAIVEGIVTLDRQGFITFFSHGAERITGWGQAQVLGLNCDQVFQTAETDQPFSALIPPPGGRSKVPVALQDGRQAVLAVTGARLVPPEGGDARVALVFRDISEEEAVHRLLSHFLANVSHEFRTPLSAVAASVELLMDQAPDLSPAELQELLTSLRLGVLNLQKLVDNLLESASIEAGRFRVYPRPSDLAEIMAEAANTMRPLLDLRGQRLILELPAAAPQVRADPRRIVQVLVNLLSNASKYGPDESEITLSAALSPGWARVTVADRGPGVPQAQRRDLFSRLVTTPWSTENVQAGFGLGLSVVKAIVEAHGGTVSVDDRPGGGSAFWFTLPAVDGSP